ncbi:MAG: hypothetical protein WCE21_01995 [Candidatus Babeliales bacterium]
MISLKRLHAWFLKQIQSPYAPYILALMYVMEGSFLFMPATPVYIAYCLARREKAVMYAAVATAASVFGGILGYCIGLFLWDIASPFLLTYVVSPERFYGGLDFVMQHPARAIFGAGLAPVPYKLVTISAGFCRIPFLLFLTVSTMTRGIRFFSISLIIRYWDQYIKQYVDRHWRLIVTLLVLLTIIIGVVVYTIYFT